MLNEIILAIVQSITEFLPISSDGHLTLISNLISTPDLSFFVLLHLASLLAVIIFVRKEIVYLFSFSKQARKLWLYIIIACIPAALAGFFLEEFISSLLSSFLLLGIFFMFNGIILLLTRIPRKKSALNWKNSLLIGLFQALALLPGVSRSGMTISSSIFSGIDRDKATKFSFLLFIPLTLGAFLLESGKMTFSTSIILPFVICFLLSLVFINFLAVLVRKNLFWVFSFYCFLISLVCFALYLR